MRNSARLTRRELLVGAGALAVASAASAGDGPEVSMEGDQVFELRQYTLYGGQRDVLIELFESHFIEPQEEVGLHVVGTFRDLDDPDRFVWLRSFKDMTARGTALPAFYGGPVWQKYRNEANATMVDSDNVLLLRPTVAGAFAGKETGHDPDAMYGVVIHYLREVDAGKFGEFFETAITPRLRSINVSPVATLTTETAANNFPRLPVRSRDRVFLWIARWPSVAAHTDFMTEYHMWSGWRDKAPEDILPAVAEKPEVLRLKPTRRSRLQ